MNVARLPTPTEGFHWIVAEYFNNADQLTHDPFKAVLYREALAKGYARSDE